MRPKPSWRRWPAKGTNLTTSAPQLSRARGTFFVEFSLGGALVSRQQRHLLEMFGIALWSLWLAWWGHVGRPLNVDVPETVHLGQWILSHGRFPEHLHWVWGQQGPWIAVGWEMGSALLFAEVVRVMGPGGLVALWAGALTLSLGLSAAAIRAMGQRPRWGILGLGGVMVSLYTPIWAALWMLPGAAFVLWDASRLVDRAGHDRWTHRALYAGVLIGWAWLSPSVLWAIPVLVGLGVLWPMQKGPRPWKSLGVRLAFVGLAMATLPDPISWIAAVGRYVSGRVQPAIPWPSVTGQLHPWPWGALPEWLAGIGMVWILYGLWRGRRVPLWWGGLLVGPALLIWHALYYTPLALWAIFTGIASQSPSVLSRPFGSRLNRPWVAGLVLTGVIAAAGCGSAGLTWATSYPEYAWYQQMTKHVPPGRVWVPLTQGGVFTLATGRPVWLDNRMQVWDANPLAYNRAAAIATGRLPIKGWLTTHHVVAILWPVRPALDARLRQAGWHVTGDGPGTYQRWQPINQGGSTHGAHGTRS